MCAYPGESNPLSALAGSRTRELITYVRSVVREVDLWVRSSTKAGLDLG